MDLVKKLMNNSEVLFLGGVSEIDIAKAEEELGISFSDEYRDFLLKFGVVSVGSHEFFGICFSKRLNVVDNTEALRLEIPDLNKTFYVIESLGIDGLYICQSFDGSIYRVSSKIVSQERIANSLMEYLEQTLTE